MHLHGKSDPATEVYMLETIEHLVIADRTAKRRGTTFSSHFVVSGPNELREWLAVALGVINTMATWHNMTDEALAAMFESFRNSVKEGK